MLNKTDIINNALLNIGEDTISDVESNESFPAEICRRFYDVSKRIVFKAVEWPFARTELRLQRFSLSKATSDGEVKEISYNDKFPYVYALPENYIFIEDLFTGIINREFDDENYIHNRQHYKRLEPSKDWDIRYIPSIGKKAIVCNQKNNVNAIYTIDMLDSSLYEDLFAEALSLYLSYKICIPITKNREAAINHLKIYNSFMEETKAKLLNEVVHKSPDFVPDMIKARSKFIYDRHHHK